MHTIQIIFSLLAATIAIAYPLYSLLMRERSAANGALLMALSVTAALEIFDLMAVLSPDLMEQWKKPALIAESCLPFAWIFYSLLFSRSGLRDSSYLQRFFLAIAALMPLVPLVLPLNKLIYSPDFGSERILFLNSFGFVFYLALTIGLTIALINLEATFAHASGLKRWNIKFEILGAMALLTGFFIYYAHSFLYRTISMNLLLVKSSVLLLAVVLIGYSQSRSKEKVRIHVSRNMAYKSLVLLVVGIYLIGLGLLGEGMQYFDRSYERPLAITIAIVCCAALLIAIFSESLKRKVQTFLSAHFYQNKYDYRGQWLQFTDRLSTARTVADLSRGIAAGYCDTFGMVCGAVYIRNDARNGYLLSDHHDMNEAVHCIGADDPLVASLADCREIIVINPAGLSTYPVLSEMLAESCTSFVIPIFGPDELNGFIILGRPLDKHETYTVEDFDLMNTIAHQAAAAMLNLRLSEQLVQAREVEVLGKVSAFMIHDLKNHVHTLSLVLGNAREHISDPEFQQDMLVSLENTTVRMKTLISRFKELPRKASLRPQPADLLQMASQVASGLAGPEIRVMGQPVHARVDHEQFPKVLTNLMLNAIDATQGKGPVTVEVGTAKNGAFIRVEDKGCGIPEEFFSQHLFSPFKTSKKSGLGIGLYHSRQIAEAHDGRIEVVSEVGKGSVFTVWLPLEKREG